MRYIRAFKDKAARHLMLGIAFFSLLLLLAIGVTLLFKALPVMKEKNVWVLLTSGSWKPFKGEYGFLPYILSTLYVSFIAIIIALPLSLLTSIYLNSYASKSLSRLFEPVIDLLSGIPPVIYGVWGTLTIVPLIADKIAPHFVEFSSGYTVLAGGLVLAIMILPLLISILLEVFRSHPKEITEASLSLGATKYEMIKVILRQLMPGLVTAILLAVGRGIGDAATVLFTAGYTDNIPTALNQPTATLPLSIFFQLGSPVVEVQNRAYASALILTMLILLLSFSARYFSSKYSKNKI